MAWYEYDLISAKTLNSIWQRLDTPLVINFWNPSEAIGNLARAHLQSLALEYEKQEVTFLNLRVESQLFDELVDEYKVFKFPTVIFYDYGKELTRIESAEQFKDTVEKVLKRVLAGELH